MDEKTLDSYVSSAKEVVDLLEDFNYSQFDAKSKLIKLMTEGAIACGGIYISVRISNDFHKDALKKVKEFLDNDSLKLAGELMLNELKTTLTLVGQIPNESKP